METGKATDKECRYGTTSLDMGLWVFFVFFSLGSRFTTGRHLVHLVDFYRDCVNHS